MIVFSIVGFSQQQYDTMLEPVMHTQSQGIGFSQQQYDTMLEHATFDKYFYKGFSQQQYDTMLELWSNYSIIM